MVADRLLKSAWETAKERYAAAGVDAQKALERLKDVSISLHCWQGDDVRGFEDPDAALGGGLAATGNYPGRARTADELRGDFEKALTLIPGRHRMNLHAMYAETGGRRIERAELAVEHFSRWIDWAKGLGLGLDFNPSYFSHPLAASGFTLSSADERVRRYWIEHGKACRRIGAEMGKSLGSQCVVNTWIPDGYKDTPADRRGPRERLAASLDEILSERLDAKTIVDAVESKLFGIGSESYVVGSHEFYLGYAQKRQLYLCLDTGHFHPTESIADKISSVLMYVPGVLLHVSRGVRWDSDHVVILSDELRALAEEIVRGGCLDRVRIGLDYFDASINRVAAWVTGARAVLQAMLIAMLEPAARLAEAERAGDFTGRLALLEEAKSLPWAAVWDWHCHMSGVPVGDAWLDEVARYERTVLAKRV
jgi:L-rhamnose isomerase